jgi:hypothetical protein
VGVADIMAEGGVKEELAEGEGAQAVADRMEKTMTNSECFDLYTKLSVLIKGEMGEVNSKISEVRSQLGDITGEMGEVHRKISDLDNKIDSKIGEVTSAMNCQLGDFRSEVRSQLGELNNKIAEVKSEVREGFWQITERVDQFKKRDGFVESRMSKIECSIDTVTVEDSAEIKEDTDDFSEKSKVAFVGNSDCVEVNETKVLRERQVSTKIPIVNYPYYCGNVVKSSISSGVKVRILCEKFIEIVCGENVRIKSREKFDFKDKVSKGKRFDNFEAQIVCYFFVNARSIVELIDKGMLGQMVATMFQGGGIMNRNGSELQI